MKSSVGVTIFAVLVLIASALCLVTAVGMALMFAGPLSQQLFDPANLPPGADVRMMRTGGLIGAVFVGAFGAFGIATGVGMVRLWKWARHAAIVLGVLVVVFTALPGIAFLFVPLPPSSGGASGAVPDGFRYFLSGFYFLIAAVGGLLVYVMASKATADQFNGGAGEALPRLRPISVSIIGWYMIASAAFGLPLMAMAHVPAFLLGLLLTGSAAKAYYILYLSLYALLGIGLLKRTSEAIAPSVGFHLFAMANAVVLLLPSVWLRYRQASASMSMFGDPAVESASRWGRFFGVGLGVMVPLVIVFFLLNARRTLPEAA